MMHMLPPLYYAWNREMVFTDLTQTRGTFYIWMYDGVDV